MEFMLSVYISNMYGAEKENYHQIENNAYFLNVEDMNVMASMYDGPKSRDPLWPLHAKVTEWTSSSCNYSK